MGEFVQEMRMCDVGADAQRAETDEQSVGIQCATQGCWTIDRINARVRMPEAVEDGRSAIDGFVVGILRYTSAWAR